MNCIFENLSAGINILVCMSSNYLSRYHKIYRKKLKETSVSISDQFKNVLALKIITSPRTKIPH